MESKKNGVIVKQLFESSPRQVLILESKRRAAWCIVGVWQRGTFLMLGITCLAYFIICILQADHKLLPVSWGNAMQDMMAVLPSVPKSEECLLQYQSSTVPAKLVVLWTTFWHRREYWPHMLQNHARFRRQKCPYWRCEMVWEATPVRARAAEADAVIFFSTDFNITDLPPRRPEQLWIWMELEAPPISERLSMWWEEAESRGVYFNLSMSWHHLSDITIMAGHFRPKAAHDHCPLNYNRTIDSDSLTFGKYKSHIERYDSVLRKNKEEINKWIRLQKNDFANFLENQSEVDLNLHINPVTFFNSSQEIDIYAQVNSSKPSYADRKNISELKDSILISKKLNKSENYEFTVPINVNDNMSFTQEELSFSGRKHIAVWMASHCSTESRREDVVRVLQKYINVTTVGKCGQQSCGKNHLDTHCYKWLASTHLFYLSFENALCDDYITEKVYRPMEHGMVPVVYGGAKYKDVLPPGSYIDAARFTSIAKLARYLLMLSKNPAQYLYYLRWRRFWQANWEVPWCSLCSRMFEANPRPALAKFEDWWNTTSTCYQVPFTDIDS